jgi:copper/silver efflux system protein
MVEKLIEYSMNNKVIIIILVAIFSVWGIWGMLNSPLDALPDLSDVQVIVWTEWMGRSPDLIEDQITYPIASTLLAAPGINFVRGQSMFGMSFVYAVFEDGTDMYWARSRVLEYLNQVQGNLPEGVTPVLGPDATGVGWVFQYTLVDTTGQQNLADLRTFNDWYLRYWLESLPGVAQVATVGGFTKQYQVTVDPMKLLAYDIPLPMVMHAIQESNRDVGGRTIEMAGTEVMVRGRGYIQSIEDIENIVVMEMEGRPIRVQDLGAVEIGGDQRRGIAEWNGEGEAVGGIVVMRYGENALNVINRIKDRIEEIKPSLPPGVTLEIAYDRSDLIKEAIGTLSNVLTKEMIIVLIVVGLFLLHFRSSLVVILTLPVAVIISFVPIYMLGLTVNVMSLGGIAIAIGAMVDAAVVLVENAHKRLEQWNEQGEPGTRVNIIIDATKEVGRPIFFSLLVITISFLPVFALEAQEGRLFKPLAYTKTFAMFTAAILSISFSAALIALFVKGKIHSEKNHPLSRILHRLYLPLVNFVLKYRWFTVGVALIAVLLAIPIYNQLGSEFMPPLEEGTILYMPTTPPGMSVAEAQYMLNIQGQILKSFPEVVSVQGKAGRGDTPTDPAPLNMFETTVILKSISDWRKIPNERWYSGWMPNWMKPPFRWIWPEQRTLSWDELINEMDAALQVPGMPNIWWMPVQTRTEMLATGVRSALAVKVLGPDLRTIEHTSILIERVLREIPGTRSAFAERPTGGYYLDIETHRDIAARYGLTTDDVNSMVEMAIGGMNITQTVEGRERYPVNIRYGRELRQDLDDIRRTYVPTPAGAHIPLGMLATLEYIDGPPMIGNEAGQLRNLVHVDVTGRDIGGYVQEARQRIFEDIPIPPGIRLEFAGQFQYMQRVEERLRILVPLTLVIIFFLLFLNFKSISRTLIVLLSVPFAIVGSFLLIWMLGYNISIAVWVGIIATAGVAAETGVVMIIYLDHAVKRRLDKGEMTGPGDLMDAIIEGAVQRLRPKLMTVVTTIIALVPIMFTVGVGAMAMQRIAAPMIGGLVTSTFLTLLIIPSIYFIWQIHALKKEPFWKG